MFYKCSTLIQKEGGVSCYGGTALEWEHVNMGSDNATLDTATRYCYTETQPNDAVYKYWHYVDGVPTEWYLTYFKT